MILIYSCDDKNERHINIHIHEIGSNFQSAGVWSINDTIYSVEPINKIKVDNNGNLIHVSTLYNEHRPAYFIEISDSGDQLLFVISNFAGVSCGALKEYSLKNGTVCTLLDSSENVSSAIFYRDTKFLIYYTFGKPVGTNPGYFLLNIETGERTLLYEYYSPLGLYETLNGFDIHPIKDELLIPITFQDRSPSVLILNILTKKVEYVFNESNTFPQLCLWLRYNNNGTKILYTNYPVGLLAGRASGKGESGIIDLITHTKMTLDLNTSTRQSESFCANWSPDNTRIVFSSAPVDPYENFSGATKLYVLNQLKP
jgi:Tol biopolymer transport system component